MGTVVRTESGQSGWLDKGRVPCLDGLRAVSIGVVLLSHASLAPGFPLPASHWLGAAGHLGVSMFFAISGFLITMLLVREATRTGTISMRGFYRRRALRILPAYILFLIAVFVLHVSGAFRLNATDWTGVLTYTVNFIEAPTWEIGHIWSLSVEEQFYIVWPLLMLLLPPGRARGVLVAYLLAAPLVRFIIWAVFREHLSAIDYLTPLRLDSIAAGCLLALVAARHEWRDRYTLDTRQAVRIAGIAALAVAGSYAISYYITAYRLTFAFSIEAAAMAAIIWCCAHAPGTLGRLLEARPVVVVGLLSYSLYLWQQLFLNPHRVHWATAWPYNILLVVGVAATSYVFVESPFLRLKDSASHRQAPSPTIVQTESESVRPVVQEV